MKTLHIEKPDEMMQKVIQASFPSYKGKKFKIQSTDRLNVKSYWDGGSRNYFTFVSLINFQAMPIPAQSAFDKQILGSDAVTIPENVCCVEHSIFQGKDLGLTFHIAPKAFAGFLPPTEDISPQEKIVLIAARSIKNTYGGATDLRFKESHNETGITREEYDAAFNSLIEKKHLRKNGSITVSGKNIVGWENLSSYRLNV